MRRCKPRKWTPELVELLYAWYGLYPNAEIAKRLSKASGQHFTCAAVSIKAWKEGLNVLDAQGYLSISELARDLGVTLTRLHKALRYQFGEKATQGRGRARFVTSEAEAWARTRYAAKPAEPWMPLSEAARRLGYALGSLSNMARSGEIRSVMDGARRRIPVAEVERILRERRRAC